MFERQDQAPAEQRVGDYFSVQHGILRSGYLTVRRSSPVCSTDKYDPVILQLEPYIIIEY